MASSMRGALLRACEASSVGEEKVYEAKGDEGVALLTPELAGPTAVTLTRVERGAQASRCDDEDDDNADATAVVLEVVAVPVAGEGAVPVTATVTAAPAAFAALLATVAPFRYGEKTEEAKGDDGVEENKRDVVRADDDANAEVEVEEVVEEGLVRVEGKVSGG